MHQQQTWQLSGLAAYRRSRLYRLEGSCRVSPVPSAHLDLIRGNGLGLVTQAPLQLSLQQVICPMAAPIAHVCDHEISEALNMA